MSEYLCNDAFMIMTYECENCMHSEKIWNSRDGVTPFGMGCPECRETMQHVRWNEDVRDPDYKPQPNERIWIDMPKEHSQDIARLRYADARRSGMPMNGKTEEEIVQVIAKDIYQEGHSPYCIRADLVENYKDG